MSGNAKAGKRDRQVRFFSHVFHIHKNLKFNRHGLGEAGVRLIINLKQIFMKRIIILTLMLVCMRVYSQQESVNRDSVTNLVMKAQEALLKKKYNKVVEYCENAMGIGDVFTKQFIPYLLAGWYAQGAFGEVDYTNAVKYHKISAELGFAPAQSQLGTAYYMGLGIKKDLKESFKWYLKAAEQGDTEGEYCVGLAYDNGDGVIQNHESAVYWYRKAAEKGDPRAQNNLALCYAYGRGAEKNESEALKWFKSAAENGEANAQYSLASIYERKTPPNTELAIHWYKKAAEQGQVQAQIRLAKLGVK